MVSIMTMMYLMWKAMCVIGEIDTSSLSGGSGWVGAGLLGLVLSWLTMIHLPAKDKQMATLLTEATNERATLFKAHREERDHMFVRFDITLDKILLSSKETNKEFREDSESLKIAIRDLAESVKSLK